MKLGLWLALLLLALSACSSSNSAVGKDGTQVGGPCGNADECESACMTGGDFPGGVCTVACETNSDCPEGSVCSEQKDGICLLSCESAADCRAGWDCEKVGLKDGGEALTCDNP